MLRCVRNLKRTTIRLDPELLAEAKKIAAGSGRSVTAMIEDALREVVSRRRQRVKRFVKLTVVGGRGVHPGLDLDDTSSLLDAMDANRGSA